MPASEVDTRIQDPDLPAGGLLLSPSASDVINRALGQEGGRVQSLTPEYASYRPGHRMLVSYRAEVEWGSAATDETIVALARNGSLPEGCVHLEAADTPVAVWRFPDDPYVRRMRAPPLIVS